MISYKLITYLRDKNVPEKYKEEAWTLYIRTMFLVIVGGILFYAALLLGLIKV